MNDFSACAPILLSTNSRYTKVTSTQATLMAAHPTRVRVVAALNATALYCLFIFHGFCIGDCWSQYTPEYQAEPIITDRYIIPLDSPIWRVRYIYRT